MLMRRAAELGGRLRLQATRSSCTFNDFMMRVTCRGQHAGRLTAPAIHHQLTFPLRQPPHKTRQHSALLLTANTFLSTLYSCEHLVNITSC